MPPTSQPPVPLPPPPFTGGQCPVGYTLFVRLRRVDVSGVSCPVSLSPSAGTPLIPGGGRGDFWGPIGGVSIGGSSTTSCGAGGDGIVVRCHGFYPSPRLSNPVNLFVQLIVPNGATYLEGIDEIAVQRVGGQPDNCGNLPTEYPPIIPPGPTVYNVDINDSQSIITVPITWTGDFSIPLTFNFEGGLIHFDFGGISIEWSGDLVIGGGGKNPYPEKPPVVLPPGQPPPGGGGTLPKPGDPPVIISPPITVTPVDPIEEEPPEDEAFLYLEIIVTSIQQDSKFIIENVNADDTIYFAGYVSFTVKDKPGSTSAPEIPIRRQKNLIHVPPEYDGYRVRATNGANLTVTSFSVKKNPAET